MLRVEDQLTGAPSARYCASLGHVQDDESGLVYMRARYYEPGTGRFISQDPNRQGANWYSYCGGDPVNRIDLDGKMYHVLAAAILGFVAGVFASFFLQAGNNGIGNIKWGDVFLSGLVGAAIGAGLALLGPAIASCAGPASQVIGAGMTALSTSMEGASLIGLLATGAMGGFITALLTEMATGIGKAILAVAGRNAEAAMILASDD